MYRGIIPLLAILLSSIFLPSPLLAEEEADADAEAELAPDVRYVVIDPAFVTNYGGADRLRFMKVDVTLRMLGEAGETAAKHHMPYIRNNLLALLAAQSEDAINSAEGKAAMREAALQSVKDILASEGVEDVVEEVLFTNFIVQR